MTHQQTPTATIHSPHSNLWTSHATTLEYTIHNGAPALKATLHIVTKDGAVTRAQAIEHILWVSGPATCTLTTKWVHPMGAMPETSVPHAPYAPYKAGETVEPCLLLGMYAPELHGAVEASLTDTLQAATMQYLTGYHAAHRHPRTPNQS